MQDESKNLMSKNRDGGGFRLLLASAAWLAGFSMMILSLCWLWLRYTVTAEVRADDGSQLLFVLVNKHALGFVLGWLIMFFAAFFRRRFEKQLEPSKVRRTRRIVLWAASGLALLIVADNLLLPGIFNEWFADNGGGVVVKGVELAAPMNANVRREASPTRPAYEFSTNEYGFRDRSLDADADRNKRRIMLVGDSFIFGSGIAQDECLPPVLEGELNGRLSGHAETRVYSVAQEGWNLEQEINAIIAMSPLLKPELVLVAHLPGNDLWPRDPMFCSQWQNRYFKEVLFDMRARQIAFFRDKEYTFADLVEDYHRNMKRLTDWAQAAGVDVMFFTYGICTYQMEKHLESGRLFVQHFPEWMSRSENMIEGDGHPTPLGNRVMAKLLAPYVIEMLQLRENEEKSGFNMAARKSMQSMWPVNCGPLGLVQYDNIRVIPQDRTPLIRDMIEDEWLKTRKLRHLSTVVQEDSIVMTFAPENGSQFNVSVRSGCDSDACRPCSDSCICFENASGDTDEIYDYVCSRLPAELWDEKRRPIENNPRKLPAGNTDDETGR